MIRITDSWEHLIYAISCWQTATLMQILRLKLLPPIWSNWTISRPKSKARQSSASLKSPENCERQTSRTSLPSLPPKCLKAIRSAETSIPWPVRASCSKYPTRTPPLLSRASTRSSRADSPTSRTRSLRSLSTFSQSS